MLSHIMSILDDIERESAINPHVHIDYCKVTREMNLAKIPDAEREALMEAMREKRITVNAGLKILRKNHVRVAYATLDRHVKSTCVCSDTEAAKSA